MTPEETCEPDTVIGVRGARYRVPDLESLDRHVTFLTMRARRWAEKHGAEDALVTTLLDDRDRLLEHRWGLQTIQGSTEPPTE